MNINCYSPYIIGMIISRRWAGHVASIGEMRNAYKILVAKPEGKRSTGRPKCRCKGNIKMYPKEIGCGLDPSGSGLGSVMGSCEHGSEPLNCRIVQKVEGFLTS
jgi:hypothetical protein